ncbi:hypothetical protein ACFUN7_05775 [Streptomyces sp. NPDC057236]|uniref:hypothetical protein n=1 Tax=Streptomyces sp. NPDC057236 TaxID=3346059 RepID=UPI00363EB579
MRGVPRRAVAALLPVEDTWWTADEIAVPLGSVGARPDDRARELWTRTDTPHDGRHLHVGLPAHGAALYRLSGARPGASRG